MPTSTSVSANQLLQICGRAKKKILKGISAIPGKDLSVLMPAHQSEICDVISLRSILSSLYTELNFVLRLEELCEINGDFMPLGIVYVQLSLEDYTRLISLAEKEKVYSVSNPYPIDSLERSSSF